jgi:hypothetical protein
VDYFNHTIYVFGFSMVVDLLCSLKPKERVMQHALFIKYPTNDF